MENVPQIIVLPAIEEWIPHTDGNGKLTEAVPCEVTMLCPPLMVVYVPRRIPCLKQYMQHEQNNLIKKGELLHPLPEIA
jgi:hypothetical protein